jgi:glycosidase
LKDPDALSKWLDGLMAQGFYAIEIFSPAEIGTGGGLPTIDPYRIEPDLGTMDDFRRLVRLAHSKGLPITVHLQLSYSGIEAPYFLKACDDIRAGRTSRETKWFLWSDSADAPPPAVGDSIFLIRPTNRPGYDSKKQEIWKYSERAGRYYWSKWGHEARSPSYNWNSPEWRQEAERIVRFWMDTGLDGMVVDGVNWYIDLNWERNRKSITNVIASYGNVYLQPEGGGGFSEDPVVWITEGGYNSVQDYGLGIWWEKSHLLIDAVETGNPQAIEGALRNYHDPVLSAGGVLYFGPDFSKHDFNDPAKKRLVVAMAALAGDLVAYPASQEPTIDPSITQLFRIKAAHPALQQLSTRRQLATNANDKYYSFLRTSADKSERIMVVLNFQPGPQTVMVDMSGVSAETLVDLSTGETVTRRNPFPVELPAYGYRLYQVK